ncbi:class I SAM-dependent methyltransferase [Halomicroarcula sp. GCM10025817]|uniref:class I SAM-dependent methyltransferase n=1 Tax=Haloarcula TaxID=2237 RepID=UPI0023E8745F|nr:class I SAM-dependent methyltransferase [Halomicroarcula sp. SYNS111]
MHADVDRFDRFARAYDLVMPRARVSKLRAGLAVADREIVRALDVGGGPGRAVRRLDVPERTVVDAAPGMIARARENGVAGVVGDATRLPVRTAAVDAVFVVDALHHIRDVDAVFAEAARVLRPGGVLVVREFDPTTVRGRGLVAAERLVGFDSAFYTPSDLTAAMSAAGLTPAVVERGFAYTVAGRR